MKKPFQINEYVEGILASDISVVSRAITLVESTKDEHRDFAQQIIDAIIPHSGNSFRLGITGVPGVGKSTFIESFGMHVIGQGHQLAVLAIDPSSEKSRGSILGDKTRMEKLSVHPKAFIRPSPSAGSLGGVARKTKESIMICEAAGYDYIIIETVGVGQSETAVHQLSDFFLLLMLAGAGDELQGIKRGIMEMADGMAITKADSGNEARTNLARNDYAGALHLFPPTASGWIPEVLTCSAIAGTGIADVYGMIDKYRRHTTASGFFMAKRDSQNRHWLHQTINDLLMQRFHNDPAVQMKLEEFERQLAGNLISPYKAAAELLSLFK